MSAAKRAREARRAKPEPYATIRPDVLLSAATGLSAPALKALLLLEASWRPGRNCESGGRAGIAIALLREMGGAGLQGWNAGRDALAELQRKKLIVAAEPAIRPGGPGGARPRAATWRLPHRDGEPVDLAVPAGIARPEGRLRWNVGRIRHDVAALSPLAIRLLVTVIALPHRDRDGALREDAPLVLSLSALAPFSASRARTRPRRAHCDRPPHPVQSRVRPARPDLPACQALRAP